MMECHDARSDRSISVVIPCLNEARCIGKLLTSLHETDHVREVIVVDGGSIDGTREIIKGFSWVRLLEGDRKQRAAQMNLAAKDATGDIIFFLHADSVLPDKFDTLILDALESDHAIGGSFYIAFDHDHWMLRFVTYLTKQDFPWITFGDHGFFFRREIFDTLNGYREIDIMEDLDIQFRARKLGKFVRIQAPVTTSARRFRNNGVLRQCFRDGLIILGYYIGVKPGRLKRYYSYSISKSR